MVSIAQTSRDDVANRAEVTTADGEESDATTILLTNIPILLAVCRLKILDRPTARGLLRLDRDTSEVLNHRRFFKDFDIAKDLLHHVHIKPFQIGPWTLPFWSTFTPSSPSSLTFSAKCSPFTPQLPPNPPIVRSAATLDGSVASISNHDKFMSQMMRCGFRVTVSTISQTRRRAPKTYQ